MLRKMFLVALGAAFAVTLAALPSSADVPVPDVDTDPRIKQIKERGALRAAAIGEYPWLPENTSGAGEPYSGPAWVLAKEFARQLDVELQVVPVSHETKVPILAAGQADITISPLSVTPARKEVVDFVIYSQSSLCLFGKEDNTKLQNIGTIDDLDRSDIVVAYFTGTPPETWVPARFNNVEIRAVAGSGSNAPVEEIMSGRADVAPIDSIAWPRLKRAVPGLVTWPEGDECLQSQEMATPIGMAIDKGQPVFLEWLNAVTAEVQEQIREEELSILRGSGHADADSQ